MIDGNFTIESNEFVDFHAFSHGKIEHCLTRFLDNEIDLSIIGGDSTNTRNNISLSCHVYYIENIIKLQNQLKIYFITQVLHKPNNLNLANDIYNILYLLITYSDNGSRLSANKPRHGSISILTDKTSTDTTKLKLCSASQSESVSAHDASVDADHENAAQDIDGEKNFLTMISKT